MMHKSALPVKILIGITCITVSFEISFACTTSVIPQYCRTDGYPYRSKNYSQELPRSDCSFRQRHRLCVNLKRSSPMVRRLDERICAYAEHHMLSRKHVAIRQRVLEDLSRTVGISSQNLTAYGSSCNGFGLRGESDLDIYLGTEDRVTIELVREISRRLHESSEFHVLYEHTKRKYFVKSHHTASNLQVDLNVYLLNDSESERSLEDKRAALFRMYTLLDPRFQILGIFLKILVRRSQLRVPGPRYLTSFSFLLMLVHYLQRTDPPILPIVGAVPYDELHGLRNDASVGELWLGFLHYYVKEFRWEDYVVSIRHSRLVTRDEKGWQGHGFLSIEDPLSPQDDGGLRLRPQMAEYILTVFNRWLKIYSTDFYDGLVNHHRVYLDDHPTFGWRGKWLIRKSQWNSYNSASVCLNHTL